MSSRETKEILDIASAMVDGDGEGVNQKSIKVLERATGIKTWGRVASESARLGYAKVNLSGRSTGDPDLTVDRFEEMTRVIESQPTCYRLALISVYQHGKSITKVAENWGIPRRNVERWVWHGLERLDAVINNVIRVTTNAR